MDLRKDKPHRTGKPKRYFKIAQTELTCLICLNTIKIGDEYELTATRGKVYKIICKECSFNKFPHMYLYVITGKDYTGRYIRPPIYTTKPHDHIHKIMDGTLWIERKGKRTKFMRIKNGLAYND